MKKAKSGLKGLIIFLICVIEVYPLFWMLTASLKQQSNEKKGGVLLYAWNYDPGCYCIDPAISDLQ